MKNQINRNLVEVMRDEMVVKNSIVSLLSDKPKTIPEIAVALQYPGSDVMYWVMAMWRYGYIEETGKPNDDGYYTYRLTNKDTLCPE